MNKIKLLLIAAAAITIVSSCNRNNDPDVKDTYPLTILINEGGYQQGIDMIGFNERDLIPEDRSLSSVGNTDVRGEFRGILMDAIGNGYVLLSNYDMFSQIDMARFKVAESNLLTDLANPLSLTLAGSNIYVLNKGKDTDTCSYVSVYSTLYDYKLIGKVNVKKGASDIYVDDNYIYIAGKKGIELYNHSNQALAEVIETPAEPVRFMTTGSIYLIVSCPGAGICVYDMTTHRISKTINVAINEDGDLVPGKDPSDVMTYTSNEVSYTNINTAHSDKIYEGEGITGVGRSFATNYTYISVMDGTKQIVFNDKREQISEFSTPSGSYTYLFNKRVIYAE